MEKKLPAQVEVPEVVKQTPHISPQEQVKRAKPTKKGRGKGKAENDDDDEEEGQDDEDDDEEEEKPKRGRKANQQKEDKKKKKDNVEKQEGKEAPARRVRGKKQEQKEDEVKKARKVATPEVSEGSGPSDTAGVATAVEDTNTSKGRKRKQSKSPEEVAEEVAERKKRVSRKSCAYKKAYNENLEIHEEIEARKRAKMAHSMQLAFFSIFCLFKFFRFANIG